MISNNTKKLVKSLQRKKIRKEKGLFVVEGKKIIEEIICERPDIVLEVFATKCFLQNHTFSYEKMKIIPEKDMRFISTLKTPPGLLLVGKTFEHNNLPVEVFKNKTTLVLDGIKDPGNLGTIIRIADWYGLEHIICSTDCVDMYNPKVLQASMGSFLRVKVLYRNLPDFLKACKKQIQAQIVVTTLNGTNMPDFLSKDVQKTKFLVVGNEAYGIRKEVLALQDKNIRLNKRGKAESLNAAVFTAILLDRLFKG